MGFKRYRVEEPRQNHTCFGLKKCYPYRTYVARVPRTSLSARPLPSVTPPSVLPCARDNKMLLAKSNCSSVLCLVRGTRATRTCCSPYLTECPATMICCSSNLKTESPLGVLHSGARRPWGNEPKGSALYNTINYVELQPFASNAGQQVRTR